MRRTCVFTGLALAITLISIFSLSTSLSARAQPKLRDAPRNSTFPVTVVTSLTNASPRFPYLKEI